MTTIQPRTEFPHVRIMASAGSGKTFQLANRYLRLLRAGAEPSSILASTFTRAAAGEIRDRILSVLADAALDEAERRKLAAHIGGPIDAAEALELLEQLTRQLHRLQIRTLDSFFAAMVRCFPFELGIDPAATIVDEIEGQAMREEAIRLMLDEADPQPIIDLLRVLTEGSSGREVTATIDGAVTGLYEIFREAPPSAWEAIRPFKLLSESEYHRAIATVEALRDLLERTCSEKGSFFNHKSICRAFANDLEFLRVAVRTDFNQWSTFCDTGIASKIALGERSFHRREIPDDVRNAYEALVQHVRAHCRNAVVDRTKSTRDLLKRFDRRYREVKETRKAITFADLTHSLLTGDAHDQFAVPALGEVYYRLDATLHHVLLDEMQDTSIPQWRVLQPIVEEIIGHATGERTFFAVGDVKQSIYGWREACPEILESLDQLLVDPLTGDSAITPDTLKKSFRSSKAVIDVVNRAFSETQSNRALEKFPEAAAQWDAAFDVHETNFPDRPGYVELRIARDAEDGEDEDRNTLRLIDAADLITKLHRASPGRSIGVLMRKNKDVNRLLYELRKDERTVPATAVGGGALTDAPPVNAILDLMRLADHPRHTIAAFNVLHSPLGPAVGLTKRYNGGPCLTNCRSVSRRVRCKLLRDGYAATVHEWIDAIRDAVDDHELRRLVQLEELAARYDAGATLRCDDFVHFAESATIDDPGTDPVQVMTIHQSKGLQFDIVVLPELEGELASLRKLKVIADREAAAGPITRIARHLNGATWEMFDDLRDMLVHHMTRRARESLSLLYVAMTRSRFALHMLISPPKSNERTFPATYAGVLRDALIKSDDALEPGAVPYKHGDPDWHTKVAANDAASAQVEAKTQAREEPHIALHKARGVVPRGRIGRSASQQAHEALPLHESLTEQHDEARDRGTALHALFETIEWIENYSPDRNALRPIVRRIAPRRSEAWAETICDDFLTMLDRQEVRDALARGSRVDGSVELRREMPYAMLVEGVVQQGIIDRLVIERGSDGVPGCATILDFKTDRVEPAHLETRAKHYHPQMTSYRSAVAEIFGIDPAQVTMELLFVAAGRLVRLEGNGKKG